MALIVCPLCVREDDVFLVSTLPDGRKEAECHECDFAFTYGTARIEEPPPAPPKAAKAKAKSASKKAASKIVPPRPIAYVVQQFPKAASVSAEKRERVEALKQEFLASTPAVADPNVTSHWNKFRWVFSADGLEKAVIFDLQLFASDPTGADAGVPAELHKVWTVMGEFEGARRVRASTAHLLRGPGELEDRLTELVDGVFPMAMPGWNEALLTKTLAVVEPDRFLTVLTYAEKREILSELYGLDLPDVDGTSWTIGRLAVWSNDLLAELLGDGFADQQHAAAFLEWAKAQ